MNRRDRRIRDSRAQLGPMVSNLVELACHEVRQRFEQKAANQDASIAWALKDLEGLDFGSMTEDEGRDFVIAYARRGLDEVDERIARDPLVDTWTGMWWP